MDMQNIQSVNMNAMKQLTTFLLILSTPGLIGQDFAAETPSAHIKGFQIGVNFSPDICFRTLKNNDGSASSESIIRLNNQYEKIKVGYTAGINVRYAVKKNIGIESGIQYSNKGYQTKVKDLVYGQPEPSAPSRVKVIYNFHYIDIPVRATLIAGEKKLRFIAGVGLTANILIKETQKSVLWYSDRREKRYSPTNFPYKTVNITPTISAGIDYKISDQMNVRIEPTLRYGILKIIDTPVTGYLYSGGLNISYFYSL